MTLYEYMNDNFSESDDDAYLESYGNRQPTKEEIKEEKRARRKEKFRNWWNTYGDAVKVGALGLGGVAVAGLAAHGLHKGLKPMMERMAEKSRERAQQKQEYKSTYSGAARKAQKEANRHQEAMQKIYNSNDARKSRNDDYKLEQKRAKDAAKRAKEEAKAKERLMKQEAENAKRFQRALGN